MHAQHAGVSLHSVNATPCVHAQRTSMRARMQAGQAHARRVYARTHVAKHVVQLHRRHGPCGSGQQVRPVVGPAVAGGVEDVRPAAPRGPRRRRVGVRRQGQARAVGLGHQLVEQEGQRRAAGLGDVQENHRQGPRPQSDRQLDRLGAVRGAGRRQHGGCRRGPCCSRRASCSLGCGPERLLRLGQEHQQRRQQQQTAAPRIELHGRSVAF